MFCSNICTYYVKLFNQSTLCILLHQSFISISHYSFCCLATALYNGTHIEFPTLCCRSSTACSHIINHVLCWTSSHSASSPPFFTLYMSLCVKCIAYIHVFIHIILCLEMLSYDVYMYIHVSGWQL